MIQRRRWSIAGWAVLLDFLILIAVTAFVAVDYVSPQMAALTGYAPADFVADPQLWLARPAPLAA